MKPPEPEEQAEIEASNEQEEEDDGLLPGAWFTLELMDVLGVGPVPKPEDDQSTLEQ